MLIRTEIELGGDFVDRCVEEHNLGKLGPGRACVAKWWTTEMQNRVIDQRLQLHGGYGCMMEYPICRAYMDARVQSIYAGANEIMKELIGRTLGY